jgi:raffinose/stachyose/melibiose transport system permease protein
MPATRQRNAAIGGGAEGAGETGSSPAGAAAAPGSARRRRYRRGLVAWLFMTPLGAVSLLVIGGPGVFSIWYSFTNWNGVGAAKFIGLANYRHMFTDPDFRAAFVHNIIWTAVFLIVPMAMGLLGAYLLSRVRRFGLFFRVAYFIPYTVSSVVGASMWQGLFSPQHGVSQIVGINFLGNVDTALGAVSAVNTWARWGFLAVVFLAAMQGVNPSLYEAAELDGAGAWNQFWHITLPSIRPTAMFLGLMIVIWSFLVFDWIYLLTGGGPGNATDVLSTVMYRDAFESQQAGYAAAIGVVLALISVVVVLLYHTIRRRKGWNI